MVRLKPWVVDTSFLVPFVTSIAVIALLKWLIPKVSISAMVTILPRERSALLSSKSFSSEVRRFLPPTEVFRIVAGAVK